MRHSARRFKALPYRRLVVSSALRNSRFRAESSAGAMISVWPSVRIFSGVSGPMFSSSSTGLSITSAQLFPCLVRFFIKDTSPVLGRRDLHIRIIAYLQCITNVSTVKSFRGKALQGLMAGKFVDFGSALTQPLRTSRNRRRSPPDQNRTHQERRGARNEVRVKSPTVSPIEVRFPT